MQILRKILSLTLALTLVLSMAAVTAVAANDPEAVGISDTGDSGNVNGDITVEGVPALKIVSLKPGEPGHSTIKVEKTREDSVVGVRVANVYQFGKNPDQYLPPDGKLAFGLETLDKVRVKVGDYVCIYESNPLNSREIYAFIAHKVLEGETDNTILKNTNLTYAIAGFWGGTTPPTDYDGVEAISIKVVNGKYDYKINVPSTLPTGSPGINVEVVREDYNYGGAGGDGKPATPENPILKMTVWADDNSVKQEYTFTFIFGGTGPDDSKDPNGGGGTGGGGNTGGGGGGGSGGGGSSSDNTANNPATVEKVKDTVDALKDYEKKLPADVTKTTTAGGKEISTIPVPMLSGSASVGMDLFKTLGDSSASVGLKFTVKAGLAGGSMEVIVPGGFGKITEVGRIGYSMDYADKAASNDDMLKAVKGENVTSTTAKIGGNQTLPVDATITVATKVANGTTVNIYKYDPHTKKFVTVGKAVAKDGKLTFATKIMGEMLFTTGTI